MILKCCVYDFERLFNDFEMNFNDLSRCSKNFVGLLSHKLFRQLLKSRIFSFNPFWLAGANQKITFWGPWACFKLIVIFDLCLNIFFLSLIP